MKVGETTRVAPARRLGRRPTGAATAAPADKPRRTADVTSIMDIPAGELTPKVQAAITRLMAEVERLRRELENTRRKVAYLEELADEDSLVPVINRRAFVRELSRMMSYVERYGAPHSVLFFDLDDLKAINDTFGHAAGDEALRHVAEILLEQVRESDVVGRLGGDEFGVILAHTDEATANDKAVHLAHAIGAKPLAWKGKRVRLSVAYGVHTIKGGEDANTALHAADRAMYAHKRGGGR